jgi:hypothetical protein
MTRVVNIRHESCDVYCGRGSPLGNPNAGGNRETNIRRFMNSFRTRVEAEPVFRQYVLSLRGKRLGCHCKPLPCHLDGVAEWVENTPSGAEVQTENR